MRQTRSDILGAFLAQCLYWFMTVRYHSYKETEEYQRQQKFAPTVEATPTTCCANSCCYASNGCANRCWYKDTHHSRRVSIDTQETQNYAQGQPVVSIEADTYKRAYIRENGNPRKSTRNCCWYIHTEIPQTKWPGNMLQERTHCSGSALVKETEK